MKVEEQKADGDEEQQSWVYFPSDDQKEDTLVLKQNQQSPIEANCKCVGFGAIQW